MRFGLELIVLGFGDIQELFVFRSRFLWCSLVALICRCPFFNEHDTLRVDRRFTLTAIRQHHLPDHVFVLHGLLLALLYVILAALILISLHELFTLLLHLLLASLRCLFYILVTLKLLHDALVEELSRLLAIATTVLSDDLDPLTAIILFLLLLAVLVKLIDADVDKLFVVITFVLRVEGIISKEDLF